MDGLNITALTPLTGRDTEVSLLADRWEQAQEGMGQVVLIIGEAGLGKSRLVQTIKHRVLSEAASPGAGAIGNSAIIEWRCSPRLQDSGLQPVADYLERILKLRDEEAPAVRFDRLAQYLDDCDLGRPELVALFAKLLFLPADERFPTPDLTPAKEREEIFRAVREWLRACSRRRPMLFVVEDLHWIDASSLEFLGQFVAEGLHDRILTVLTFRPEFQTPWPAVAHQTSLALNRLSRRQAAELTGKVIGRVLPDSLVAQIYQRTGGVPLLVEEFARVVREWTIFDEMRQEEIPATLPELVLARLDRLSGNREVAHYAAALGREFQYWMLAGVVNVDETTLRAELAKLESAEILYRKGEPPDCTYTFKHALLEEALQTTLDEPRKRHFHRRVAELMEGRFPESVETQPEILAQHFAEADLPEKAAGYWLRAGKRSQQRFANVEAIGHLTKGLEMLRSVAPSPERDATELEMLGPLGTAYIATAGYASPEVGPIFQRARTLLSAGTEPTTQAFVMLRGHFAYHIVRGDFRLCTELAEESVQLGERLNDPGILMEALFLQGLARLYRGDFIGAQESCARALADYDDRARTAFWAEQTGENSGVAHRCYLALASWHLGFPGRALSLSREAGELARSLQHPFTLEYALHHAGWLHQHCRLGAETQAAGEEEIRIAVEQGFLFWQASGTLYAAAGQLLRGQLDEGLRRFQNGLDAYRATGAGLGLPYYLSILGEALMRVGRSSEAGQIFDQALELVEKNDERFQEAELHRLQGELHLVKNDHEAAEKSFQHALGIARQQKSKAWELRTAVSLARLWQRLGRQNEAFTLLTATFSPFSEGWQTPDLMDAAAVLRELSNERMRDDVAAGIRYIRGCIPRPLKGSVAVNWRYVPSSTLGGDLIGYHWLDGSHFAFYLVDVTGHGLDSALLAISITNLIRSGSIAGADLRRPQQVLMALNEAFQGVRHGYKYFTLWYGVYHSASRTLVYSSGGHPSAIAILPGQDEPMRLPATGPVMGAFPGTLYPEVTKTIPPGTRLFVFSDGVFEARRDHQVVWDLPSCIDYLNAYAQRNEEVMDALLAHLRELHGAPQLEDDFSIVDIRIS